MRRNIIYLAILCAVMLIFTGGGAVAAADAPSANFTSNVTSGSAPLSVQFNDTSTGEPTSWSWDFGDNATSPEQNPVHTYLNTGNYSVSLTAANVAGNNSITKTNFISVVDNPPVVNFTGDNKFGVGNCTVHFTDNSNNSPTSWLWDFGDGNISTEQNPNHVYRSVGNYTVSLTATNTGGSSNLIKTNYIQVVSNIITTYQNIYILMSNHNGTKYSDGGPNNTYYFVNGGLNQLHITNNASNTNGQVTTLNSSQSGTFYITTTGGRSSNDNLILLIAVKGPISDDFSVNIVSNGYYWNSTPSTSQYGVGINETFTKSDFFYGPQVLRPASSSMGVIYSGQNTSDNSTAEYLLFVDLKVGNLRAASFPTAVNGGAATVQFTFNNLTTRASFDSYAWATGYYLKWTNDATQSGYNVVPVPVANFTANVTNGTIPMSVNFIDTSINGPSSWLWDFGDGTTSTEQNPTHIYSTLGNYTVNLSVANVNGNNTITKTDYINVNWAAPVANFTTNATSGLNPLNVQFTDASQGNVTGWAWDFNNDGVIDSTEQNPVYNYNVPGNYSVALTVTGPGGNSTITETGIIMVFNSTPPSLNASLDSGVYNTTQNIVLSSDQPDSSIYYTTDGSDPRDSDNSNRVPYSDPIPISSTTQLQFAAVNSGGVWSSRYSKNYTIDTSIPSVTANPVGGLFNGTQNIVLISDDVNATIYFSLDGSNPTNSSNKYTGPINISTTTTLRYVAVDLVGNWGTIYAQNYTIDTVAPTASVNVKGGVYTTDKTIVLTMNKIGTIYYTLNGSTPTKSSTKYTGPIKLSSSKTLRFIAVDLAGNVSPLYTQKYTIDKTAPKITVTNPKSKASKVSTTSTIVIKFSEKVKSSINWSKVYIKNLKTGQKVSISKVISGNSLKIKMKLKRYHKTWYSVYIPSSAIKDAAGNKLAKGYTLKFKTN